MFVFIMNINKTISDTRQLTEVFGTTAGSVYQCDLKECWYVDFGGKVARFDYGSLLRLKRTVENVSIEKMLLDPAKGNDFEIISLSACDHLYVLTAIEILALKELLHGTFVMLKLNHLVKDCLCRVI
jgi:hypothetical protein